MRFLPLSRCLFLALALPAFCAAETTSIELILDCSGSMWNKLADGRYRMDAAKEVLGEFIATAPDVEGLHVGLRLYGAQIPHREAGACDDSTLVVPVDGFNRAEMLRIVRAARALGATPLARSLDAAAGDFVHDGKKQVIVFTDGEESCGGDVRAALVKLKADGVNADIRIIGIGLPRMVAERYGQYAPVENVDSLRKLAEALKNATAATITATAKPAMEQRKVTFTLVKSGEPAGAKDVGLTVQDAAGAPVAVQPAGEPGVFTCSAPPGLYSATTQPGGRQFRGLSVPRGEDATFTLDVTEYPQVKLDLVSETSLVLQPGTIQFSGAQEQEGQYVIIAPVGSPDEAEPAYAAAYGKEGEVSLRMPDAPGDYEARFAVPRAGGAGYVICGRSKPFPLKMRQVSIKVPATVPAATMVKVDYVGTADTADWIGWVKAGAPDGEYVAWTRLDPESPEVRVQAPADPGDYEMRYASDLTPTPLARAPFKVVASESGLTAPDSAMAGTLVPVTWKSAATEGIFITIVAKDAEATAYNDYLSLKDAEANLLLQAPRITGDLELRMVAEGSNSVLFRRPIKLTEMKATLKAPATATRGTALAVEWTGPGGDGDFVTVVAKGAEDEAYLEYFYTRDAAAKAELPLPDAAGEYEVRYVARGNHVLARHPLVIQ